MEREGVRRGNERGGAIGGCGRFHNELVGWQIEKEPGVRYE
jgi:hypothetical protein